MLIKHRKKWKSVIALAIGLFFLVTLSYSIFNIGLWASDTNKTKEQISIVNQVIKESGVDFDKLKKINPDTKGWLKVNGTNIDYPFLQTTDNNFYLAHSFDKSSNQAGWLFMDYRNDINDLDKNTIIYAHARIDNTMFGSMRNMLKQDWYTNNENRLIKLESEKQQTAWEIISVYRVKTSDDYIQTSFNTQDEFKSFLKLIKDRSIYDFNNLTDKNDKILTLSTCYNDAERIVLHAKLVPTTLPED